MNTEQAKPKTEIELAAEKFEYLASGAPLSNVLYGYPSQKRLWWLAAQALFEQAERKKGCDKNKFYGHNFCRNCGKDLNAPGVTFDGCCWAESAIAENKPLALEQVKAIEEPPRLWIVDLWGEMEPHYELVNWEVLCACPLELKLHCISLDGGDDFVTLENYGKTWLAYDHEPKEAE